MFSNITNQFTSLVGAVKGGQGEEEMGATSQPESVTAPALQEIVVAPEPIAEAGAETDETKGGWLGSAKGWLGNASIPSMPAMPSMPSIPSMPTMPSMPTIPSIPGLRKVNNEEGSSEGASNPIVAASATNVPIASGAGSSLTVEEDDKSKYISSTEGADPDATSGGGTPTNDEGQIGQVTTKVTQQAKHFGSFLTSAISKAGNKITETVKANPILESFNKEQEAFIKGQSGGNSQGMAPWVGHPNEIKIKEEIMGLSQDRRNFVRAPPAGVDFDFNYDTTYSTAVAIMAEDKALETMRFELVPKIITEENFWRNYFYRVSLIIQAAELGTLGEDGVTQASSGEDEEHWEKKLEAELRDCEAVEGACVSSTVIRTSIAQGYNNDSFNYSGDEMPTLSNIRARSTNNEWEEYADLIEDTDDLK